MSGEHQRLVAQLIIDAWQSPEPVSESLLPDGSRLRTEKNVGQIRTFISCTDAHGALRTAHTVFEPADDRPDRFPPDLPFLPGHLAAYTQNGEKPMRMVIWSGPDDLEPGFTQLVMQTSSPEWTEDTDRAINEPSRKLRVFVSERYERFINLAGEKGMEWLSLAEAPMK